MSDERRAIIGSIFPHNLRYGFEQARQRLETLWGLLAQPTKEWAEVGVSVVVSGTDPINKTAVIVLPTGEVTARVVLVHEDGYPAAAVVFEDEVPAIEGSITRQLEVLWAGHSSAWRFRDGHYPEQQGYQTPVTVHVLLQRLLAAQFQKNRHALNLTPV